MHQCGLMPPDVVWLRHVPVSNELAAILVGSEIMRLRPRAVICCGMAEKRQQLSIERQAKRVERQARREAQSIKRELEISKTELPPHAAAVESTTAKPVSILQTTMDIEYLMADTLLSEVSEDAGTYVCNFLYYDLLDLVCRVNWEMAGVFIHIPIFNPDSQAILLQDFLKIVNKISEHNC